MSLNGDGRALIQGVKQGPVPTCIWMDAGLIAYRLCDRKLECDNCLFDRVMRGKVSNLEQLIQTPMPKVIRGPRFLPGFGLDTRCFYSGNHLWFRVEEKANLRIGLDHFGSQLLGSIRVVEPPAAGSQLGVETPIRITNELGEFHLLSPVPGRVVWNNPAPQETPALVSSDPYDRGSMMIVETDDLAGSLKNLHFGKSAETWLQREVEELAGEVIAIAFEEHPAVGITATDGGEVIADYLEVIRSQKSFRSVLKRFLGALPAEEGESKWY